MQTKIQSMVEATANIISGMIIAFVVSQLAHEFEPQIQQHIWNGFEWKVGATSNVVMTVILTAISLVRSYIWRRHFNAKIMRSYNETTTK